MIEDILIKLKDKKDLQSEEMQCVVESIMTGEVEDNDIETFLLALNEKGIKEPEITAAASVMRDKSLKFDIGDGTHIDTCGTGGTGLHTFNCSTASSFVAAGFGARAMKATKPVPISLAVLGLAGAAYNFKKYQEWSE